MEKIIKSPIISDGIEITKLEKEFRDCEEKFNKQVYTSQLSEKGRYIYFHNTWTLKPVDDKIKDLIVTEILKDFNTNIEIKDIYEGVFLKGGTKVKGKISRVNQFDLDKGILELMWFTNESMIIRKFNITKYLIGSKKYKIYMSETVKGLTGLVGMQGVFIKNKYIKNRSLDFQMSMIKFEINNVELSKKKLVALEMKKIKLAKIKER